jgi:hypothetical protein
MAGRKPHDKPEPHRRQHGLADDVAQAHQAQVNQVRHEPVRARRRLRSAGRS